MTLDIPPPALWGVPARASAPPALPDTEIRLAMFPPPLTHSFGPSHEARGKRLGRTGFVERSRGPSTLRWCGGKLIGKLESVQLSRKNESGPSCVIPDPMRRMRLGQGPMVRRGGAAVLLGQLGPGVFTCTNFCYPCHPGVDVVQVEHYVDVFLGDPPTNEQEI